MGKRNSFRNRLRQSQEDHRKARQWFKVTIHRAKNHKTKKTMVLRADTLTAAMVAELHDWAFRGMSGVFKISLYACQPLVSRIRQHFNQPGVPDPYVLRFNYNPYAVQLTVELTDERAESQYEDQDQSAGTGATPAGVS